MTDPIELFSQWYIEAALEPSITEPTAMTLATATREGKPSARIVLLKEHGQDGFLFYTNHESRKSHELKENPYAALCFYWMPMGRQIRIEGHVIPSTSDQADAYFASRSRERKLGAWASLQSQPLDRRETLDARVAEYDAKFKGVEVPRPPHWSGWRLKPESIEFWQLSEARLHEREIYTRTEDGWVHSLLYP